MRFQFYTVEVGANASLHFREIKQNPEMEPPKESAKAMVNQRYQELVARNPSSGQIIVVRYATGVGDAPSTVVAVDLPLARPNRQLIWAVDP